MVIHSFAYKRKDSLESNIQALQENLKMSKQKGELNIFFLGELAFAAYEMQMANISRNKFAQNSDRMNMFKSLAKQHDVCLCFGYIEEDGSSTYNSQIFIDSSGKIIHNHRKNNLTKKESSVFQKGASPVSSFTYAGYKFSLAICYDLFAKDFRDNYERDTDIFLHSLTDPQDGRFTLGFSGRYTRALYVAANRFETDYNGHIGFYSSAGTKLAFSMGTEKILSYKIVDRHLKKRYRFLLYIKIFFHLLRYPRKTLEYLSWTKDN